MTKDPNAPEWMFKENNITTEQGEAIKQKFESVGVELTGLKYTDMYDNHFYEGDRGFVWNNGAMTDVVIVDGNNAVRKINYRGTPLYMDGQAVSNISEHTLVGSEWGSIRYKPKHW